MNALGVRAIFYTMINDFWLQHLSNWLLIGDKYTSVWEFPNDYNEVQVKSELFGNLKPNTAML